MRFYVPPELIFPEKNLIEIKDKKELHHIRDVMRLRRGARVNIFDGGGREYLGEIKNIDKNLAIIEIKDKIELKSATPYKVILYQAVPKKAKMDFIVEKSVELGVDTIVPMVTERAENLSIKGSTKIERWARITRAASKQCGRIKIPTISDPVNFHNALIESRQNDLVIFAALDKDAKPLREGLKTLNPKNIALFVGPEGDFTESEISMARKEGYNIYSLGPLVLRAETAALFILSCLNYEYTE